MWEWEEEGEGELNVREEEGVRKQVWDIVNWCVTEEEEDEDENGVLMRKLLTGN